MLKGPGMVVSDSATAAPPASCSEPPRRPRRDRRRRSPAISASRSSWNRVTGYSSRKPMVVGCLPCGPDPPVCQPPYLNLYYRFTFVKRATQAVRGSFHDWVPRTRGLGPVIDLLLHP